MKLKEMWHQVPLIIKIGSVALIVQLGIWISFNPLAHLVMLVISIYILVMIGVYIHFKRLQKRNEELIRDIRKRGRTINLIERAEHDNLDR